MNQGSSDDQLMMRIRDKDFSAFEVLFDRHSSAVFGYCMRTLAGDRALAEDITQTVWLKLLSSAGHYTPQGNFKAWLMTITRNETFRLLEKQGRLGIPKSEELPDAPSPENIEEDFLAAADAEALRQAVQALPEAQRLVLTLWIEEEASYEGIAERLGTSATAVRGLLYRAKQELRRILEKK